jgi:hypothetical protein
MEKRRSQQGISFRVVDHLDQPSDSTPLCPQCQIPLKDVPDTTGWHCKQCQEYYVEEGMSYDFRAKRMDEKGLAERIKAINEKKERTNDWLGWLPSLLGIFNRKGEPKKEIYTCF